jgi:hypothetical protein
MFKREAARSKIKYKKKIWRTQFGKRRFTRTFYTEFKKNPQKFSKFKKAALTGSVILGGTALYKLTFGEWAELQGLHALSIKLVLRTPIQSIETMLETITKKKIKNLPFALQQIGYALAREENAQKQGSIVAYHSLRVSIYQLLDLYTTLYNEKHGLKKQENFVYVRTFEEIEHKIESMHTKAESGLALMSKQIDDPVFSEYWGGFTYLVSFCPFLFQLSLNREETFQDEARVIEQIAAGLCALEGIFNKEDVIEIKKLLIQNRPKNSSTNNIFLQFVFYPDHVEPLEKLKKTTFKNIKNFDPEQMCVGYANKTIFTDLYWAQSGGMPATQGAKIFDQINKLPIPIANAKDLQLRLVVTPQLLKRGPRAYSTHIVHLNKDPIYHSNDQEKFVNTAREIFARYTPKKEPQQKPWYRSWFSKISENFTQK